MADWSKIGKRARRTGGEYERKICHFLTDVTGVKFKRAPRSGALLREGKINGVYISGDLTSEKAFAFSIECKKRQDASFGAILKNPQTAAIVEYWHQCVYDANISDKSPMLFFYVKQIRSDMVAVDDHGLSILGNHINPVMRIGDFVNPVTHIIDQKEVSLTLPPMNIMHSNVLKDANVDSAFMGDI